DDRAINPRKQMLKKSDDLLASNSILMRLDAQLDSSSSGRYNQSADDIDTLVVLNMRADLWRMASRCPCSLEWADQAKAAFVHKDQACSKFTTLFLSAARCSASNGQSFHHCVATLGVAVSDNSIPFDSEYATRCWDG